MDFDVILGMDWFSPYHAKTVILDMPGLLRLEWMGTLDYIPNRVVSFIKAHRMVEKGCEAYIAFVRDVSADNPTVKSVLVLRDFPVVFPADLPSMSPDRDINFGINLLPGSQPISIPHYHMELVDLNELKEQL
ncbi:uncharacterized protein [Nicotiana tomentosiformis]|uniref:uncharacterized protein n=1 Tax=Nicotiana tomentosiformis TaxID=4098 RepID=UPI00388C3867